MKRDRERGQKRLEERKKRREEIIFSLMKEI